MDCFENWIFDILTQYMCSAGWNLPIQNFIDDHCECFEESEENKLFYTEIFESFTSLVEKMLQRISEDLEIAEGIMVGVLFEALRSQRVSKYFIFVLATQEFLVFKHLMVKRNLELELETLKQAENSRNPQAEEDLRLALSLSLICQEELEASRIQRVLQEEEDLKKALELSSLEYIEEINQQKARLLQEISEFSSVYKKKQQEKTEKLETSQTENLQKMQKEVQDMKNKIDDENSRKNEELANIQQLLQKKREILEARKKIEELKKEEEKKLISKKIERKELEDRINDSKVTKNSEFFLTEKNQNLDFENIEKIENIESLEERKNRLKIQREQVKRKIREDRVKELDLHLASGGIDFSRPAENLSHSEYKKRKRILEKLKNTHNLPFNDP